MRKIIVLTSIIILALVLTGCGSKNKTLKQNETSTINTQQASEDGKPIPEDSATKSTGSKPPGQTTATAAIVAKSENIMSSSEKEELLSQVDKELDSLFSNINSIEDTPESDLDLNQ